MQSRTLCIFLGVVVLASLSLNAHAQSCTSSYAGTSPQFHMGNFARIPALPGCYSPAPGTVFRGGVPAVPEGMQSLANQGVSTIIDLYHDDGAPNDEENWAASHGMTYVSIPLHGDWNPVPATIPIRIRRPGSAVAEVRQLAPSVALWAAARLTRDLASAGRNTFVHCRHGQYRTGMFIELLRACGAPAHSEDRCFGGGEDQRAVWQIAAAARTIDLSLAPNPEAAAPVTALAWLSGRTSVPCR